MFNWFSKKKKEKEELEASIVMLSKKRSEMTQETISLEEQLTDLRKEVQKESSHLDDKRATNYSLQQRNAELQKELDNLENKKKESLDYIQNKESDCSILNQKQKMITESLQKLEKTVSERQLEIKELDKSIFIKKDELNTTIKDIENVKKQIRNQIYVETISNSRDYALLADKRTYMYGREWRKYMLQSIGFNQYLSIDGIEHATELDLFEKKFNCRRDVRERCDKSWNTSSVPDAVWSLCNDY